MVRENMMESRFGTCCLVSTRKWPAARGVGGWIPSEPSLLRAGGTVFICLNEKLSRQFW